MKMMIVKEKGEQEMNHGLYSSLGYLTTVLMFASSRRAVPKRLSVAP